MALKILFARLFGRERRHENTPVAFDRRNQPRRMKSSDAQERLDNAVQDLEQTVRLRTEDFLEPKKVANDSQQVVLWGPFQEICRFRGSDALKIRLCRHSRHQDAANTELAICEENKCPILLEAIGGVVA